MHPCGQRLRSVIGVTFVVNRKQGLLNKVFHIIGQADSRLIKNALR
jgi:hypothetical protein